MKNGEEASPSIILAGRVRLEKMPFTFEPRGIFGSNFCILMYFNIVQQLACQTVMRLHLASFWPVLHF